MSLIHSAVSAFSAPVLSCLLTAIFSKMLKTLLSLSFCLTYILHIYHSFSHPCPVPCSVFCLCLTQSAKNLLYVPKKYLYTSYMRLLHLSEGKIPLPYFFLGTNNCVPLPWPSSLRQHNRAQCSVSCGWFCVTAVAIVVHLYIW